MHIGGFKKGKGKFVLTEYVPTDERAGRVIRCCSRPGASSAIIMSEPRRAALRMSSGTKRTVSKSIRMMPSNVVNEGDWVKVASRAGETTLRALVTDRVAPGVVYTTFHHPSTQVNVVTTDFSDWATNCPEFKVTAVQISRSNGPTTGRSGFANRPSRAAASPSSRSRGMTKDLKGGGRQQAAAAFAQRSLPRVVAEPGYQFCTLEYLICALSSATSSLRQESYRRQRA